MSAGQPLTPPGEARKSNNDRKMKTKLHALYQTRFIDGTIYLVPNTPNWGNWAEADAIRYHGASHPTALDGARFDSILARLGAQSFGDVSRVAALCGALEGAFLPVEGEDYGVASIEATKPEAAAIRAAYEEMA